MPYSRIAQNLLELHCDVESFDVDFYDLETAKVIAEELEKLGAKVESSPHTTSLHVTCPEKDAGNCSLRDSKSPRNYRQQEG